LAWNADEHEAISGRRFVVAPADAGVDDDLAPDGDAIDPEAR
jgi:hypothetical protein